ncbi:MAG: AbrB/MazE/SpoVT family DNA-binding domain-containing protein [Pyrinomonadaceae bacterium]
MATTVSSKCQAVIPRNVRKALGITPGSKVDFVVEGKSVRLKVVRPKQPSRVEDGPRILGYKGPLLTLDDMRNAIKRRAQDSL